METLKNLIVESLDSNKANDVVVIDFDHTHPLVDYFVVADAPSMRQLNALADRVVKDMQAAGFNINHAERQEGTSWILIDAIDVIIHLFLTEDRSHYNLEKLYRDFVDESVL